VGAGVLARPFDQAIDYVHERKLDGLVIFEQGDGVKLHVDALGHAFNDAGVEIAEELSPTALR
jgi:hypothetical protein